MLETFKCPNCGAPLDAQGVSGMTMRCPYCNTSVIVPDELRRSKTSPAPKELSSVEGRATGFKLIKELVMQGNKIAAIQLIQRIYPLNLKEASEMVDSLASGQVVEFSEWEKAGTIGNAANGQLPERSLGTTNSDNPIYNEVLRLLRAGQKIDAIRLYKERIGCNLNEANIVVSGIEARYAAKEGWKLPKKVLGMSAIAGGTAGIVGCIIPIVISSIVLVFILFMLTFPGGPLDETWSRINPFGVVRLSQSFGKEGIGPGLFTDVRQIAVNNSDGNLYAADYDDGRVQAFDSRGEFLSLWVVGDGNTEVYITGLAVDRQNRVYISGSGKIYIYDGASGDELGLMTLPENTPFAEDIIATADGGLLVVFDNEDILCFNSNGELTLSIPASISSITGDSETTLHLAADGVGNIYALAWNNDAVFKFDSGGHFVTRFGSEGEEPGQFSSPYAIAVDGLGQIYVSDIRGIQVFDADGRYLRKFSVHGVGFDLVFNDQGDLFVASNSQKILRYTLKK